MKIYKNANKINKIVLTKSELMQVSKKKKKYNPNPWAVCEKSVGKKNNPEKFERCVQKVKEQQK